MSAENVLIGEPGTRYTSWAPAAPGEVYAPGAFDRSVDQIITTNYGGVPVGHSRIIAAEVAGDGSGATLTLEVVDRSPQVVSPPSPAG